MNLLEVVKGYFGTNKAVIALRLFGVLLLVGGTTALIWSSCQPQKSNDKQEEKRMQDMEQPRE